MGGLGRQLFSEYRALGSILTGRIFSVTCRLASHVHGQCVVKRRQGMNAGSQTRHNGTLLQPCAAVNHRDPCPAFERAEVDVEIATKASFEKRCPRLEGRIDSMIPQI